MDINGNDLQPFEPGFQPLPVTHNIPLYRPLIRPSVTHDYFHEALSLCSLVPAKHHAKRLLWRNLPVVDAWSLLSVGLSRCISVSNDYCLCGIWFSFRKVPTAKDWRFNQVEQGAILASHGAVPTMNCPFVCWCFCANLLINNWLQATSHSNHACSPPDMLLRAHVYTAYWSLWNCACQLIMQ